MMKPLLYFFIFIQITLKSQIGIDGVLNNFKTDTDLQHASYGFCVIDVKTDKTIKEYNSQLALIPASTLKIVTTGAALGILKKDFTYKTNFSIIYKGDSIQTSDILGLKVYGVGDPSFNSGYFYNNDSLFFSGIIKKIKLAGVKKINAISVDNSYFNNAIPDSWIWGDICNYFGASPNGLSYKDNKFSIFYTSAQPNTLAKIESIKPNYFSEKIKLQSDVLSFGTEDEAYVYGNPNEYTRKVSGTIPPNKTNYEIEAQMPEPEAFFNYELTNVLKKNNLFTAKENINILEDKTLKSKWIYTHASPKLEKIIFYTNTKSNNHYAESLLKTVGAIKSGKQGTTENGIDVVKKYWESRGINLSGLHMVDGSGLSRANTLTTKIQAEILTLIYNDSLMYDTFNNSLPIAGKNGSMTSLCKGTFAENNLRAKTGYINRARGYCGYVKTKSGKNLAFSILFNNYDCSPKEMKLKIEKFLVALVEL
jgi:D-alanyl-D-alanine carboxypeptidase/D-alanyl-D-alanine-endopeptidase (penicillin-binding protein 4)